MSRRRVEEDRLKRRLRDAANGDEGAFRRLYDCTARAFVALRPSSQLAVSLETPGGAPTGPVVFQQSLVAL